MDCQHSILTNRDTLHAAISEDEGQTWRGFREVGLDEHRARADYATWDGPQDRGAGALTRL